MELNIDAVLVLIKEKFRNNKTWFAEEIGVDGSYLNSILNGKAIKHSPKVCNGVINYCNKNNLNYKEYIILPSPVQKK